MNAKIVFLSTALAVALASASAAHAADAKVYPSDACQALDGREDGALTHYASVLRNESTSSKNVTCPIVRDNIGNTNGVVDADVRVQSTAGASLRCDLYSYSALGDLVAYDSVITTSQNVNVLPLDIDVSTQGGTYSIACSLPPEGRIYGYSVNEY